MSRWDPGPLAELLKDAGIPPEEHPVAVRVSRGDYDVILGSGASDQHAAFTWHHAAERTEALLADAFGIDPGRGYTHSFKSEILS